MIKIRKSIILLMALILNAGCSTNQNNNKISKVASKYHLINAENFIDKEFNLTKYFHENKIAAGFAMPSNERERKISNNYVLLPVGFSRDNEDFVHVLIFDNSLNLRYKKEYKRSEFNNNRKVILSSAFEKEGVLFFDGVKCNFSGDDNVCRQLKKPGVNHRAIKNIVFNGDKNKTVKGALDAFEYGTGINRLFYSNININTGEVFRDTIAQSSRGCEENNKSERIICPSVKYKTKREGELIIVSHEKIKRDSIEFVVDADNSRKLNQMHENNYQDMITIMPLDEAMSVNLIKAKKNFLFDEMSKNSGIFFESGAFVYKKTVAGFDSNAMVTSYGVGLSDCNILISTIKRNKKTNKREMYVSSFNICKLKKA